MSWHLAPSLSKLRDEVNRAWPTRSKASDGTIGDSAHSARVSDHNPNMRGSVNAIDITTQGINTDALINAAKQHQAVRYIIHNRRIMNRDIDNFRSRPYNGPNPHTQHVHISIYQTVEAENNTTPWKLTGSAATPKVAKKAPAYPLPAKHWYGLESKNPRNHSGYYTRDQAGVRKIQARLKQRGWTISVDGIYGPETTEVVRRFQQEKHLTVDGLTGPETWRALWEEPIT